MRRLIATGRRLWGGRGWERGKADASSSALLSKKWVGREGSIKSQQKFDFFCSDIMPEETKIAIGYVKKKQDKCS